MQSFTSTYLVLIATVLINACGNSNEDIESLPDLHINQTLYTFLVGNEISPVVLPNSGDAPTSCEQHYLYSLPEGLTLEAAQETCVIRGTPIQAQEKKGVIITASNQFGSDYVSTAISILNNVPAVSDLPPDFEQIGELSFTLTMGIEIIPIVLANNGGAPTRCMQSEPYSLPEGLELVVDQGTCVIQGTPILTYYPNSYVIVDAANGPVITTSSITITIEEPFPLSADQEIYTLTTEEPIEPVVFRIPIAVESCSVRPQLPSGLNIQASSDGCTISGTADQPVAIAKYIVIAEHNAGLSGTRIAMRIVPLHMKAPILPPDPGDAGKATLPGIDADNDGVRDDLQRYIALEYPYSEKTRRVLTEMVQADQEFMLYADNKEQVLIATNKQGKQIDCLYYIDPEGAHDILKAIKPHLLNTEVRIRAWIKANSHLGGMSFPLPEDKKVQCSFDPDLLDN